MFQTMMRTASVAVTAILLTSAQARADEAQNERGKYLVDFGGCNDCHTPGYFFGKPDMDRALSGSDVGFEMSGLGVFVGPNLTPDKETGLGDWSEDEIVTALRTGERPDGRILAPIMPWPAIANLTQEELEAIAAYLKSLKPLSNKVPGPFGPGEEVTVFMMRTLPPGETAAQAPN